MKKIVTVLGTRPEIVKFSPVLPLFDKLFRHVLVHTGQHYDENMDRVFFRELKLKAPKHFLNAGEAGAGAGAQTGRMLERLEPILAKAKPDGVAVLGDTNSTLAGALVAAKLDIPVFHLEAGCRSFNRSMPEETNRVIVDHISDLLFAPDRAAVEHLCEEGLITGVHEVGNTGLDATRRTMALVSPKRLERFGVKKDGFVLVTIHRAENTNDIAVLSDLIAAINAISSDIPVIFPVHPRTAAIIGRNKLRLAPAVRTLPPLGNLDLIALLQHCVFVMSDSGGIQEEAAVVNRPCLVLREETEWTRLVDAGKNFLAGTSTAKIVKIARRLLSSGALRTEIQRKKAPLKFGASERVARIILRYGAR